KKEAPRAPPCADCRPCSARKQENEPISRRVASRARANGAVTLRCDMVVYHLGFPAYTYLIARIYPQCKVIECGPLTDTVDAILAQLDGHRDFLFHIDLSVQEHVPPRRG